MGNIKVLAVTPLKPGKIVEPEIFYIEGVDLHVVDNYVAPTDKQPDKKELSIFHCYERAREMFLKGDWDFLLTIEDDVHPPKNIVDLLMYSMRSDTDVVVANVRMNNSGNIAAWIAPNKDEQFYSITNFKDAVDKYNSGELIEVDFVPTMCNLIKREVVEKVEFEWKVGSKLGADLEWSRRVRAAGFHIFLDPKAMCGQRGNDGSLSFPPEHLEYSVKKDPKFEEEWGDVLRNARLP